MSGFRWDWSVFDAACDGMLQDCVGFDAIPKAEVQALRADCARLTAERDEARAESDKYLATLHAESRLRESAEAQRAAAVGAAGTWETLLKDANEWFDRVIPHTAESDVLKFQEEAAEFVAEPSVEEAADVLMCLTHFCYLKGFDLKAAVETKLAKNKARTWVKREDGTWKHVKEPQ
jgi:hypothetical protein